MGSYIFFFFCFIILLHTQEHGPKDLHSFSTRTLGRQLAPLTYPPTQTQNSCLEAKGRTSQAISHIAEFSSIVNQNKHVPAASLFYRIKEIQTPKVFVSLTLSPKVQTLILFFFSCFPKKAPAYLPTIEKCRNSLSWFSFRDLH